MSEKRMAIIASKGTLDWAYPPLVLASTAAALGYETKIFCTFYGLELLRKKLRLKVSPVGNPALPMPFPMPTLLQSLPGMQALMTAAMKRKIRNKGVASIEELRSLCLESGVELIGCQMTIDLFDYRRNDLVEGIAYAGAASFLEFAGAAQIQLSF